MKIGIIAAKMVFDSDLFSNFSEQELTTPYGVVTYKEGIYNGKQIVFIPREGSINAVPPHLVNYRANVWAMKKLDVHSIIAIMVVGSVNQSMKLGDFVFPTQFLDFTKSRISTFYEGGQRGVVHIDVTDPYCERLNQELMAAAQNSHITAHPEATFACYEGPRFQTKAETAMIANLGCDLVGMTGVPEVVLAREAEMCYAVVAIVGRNAVARNSLLSRDEVVKLIQTNKQKLKVFLAAILERSIIEDDCSCQHSLAEYGGFKL